jgi:hypothetical protein
VSLAHSPFTIAKDPENPDNDAIFNHEESTFQYESPFGIVVLIANTTYHNLVLTSNLVDYRIQNSLTPPTEQDLLNLLGSGGNLTVLGEQKTMPKIDITTAQKELAARLAPNNNIFSPNFDPARARNFVTDVRVQEGAVYTIDGANDMSLLMQGESLRVGFKEKEEKLSRPGRKEPEVISKKPIPQPVIVTGNNRIEPGKVSVGQAKPVTPVVTDYYKGIGSFGTFIKNPGKDVFVQCAGGNWQAAKDGMVILPGDVVSTAPAGSVEVLMDGGKVGRIEIKEGSLFRISKAERDLGSGDKTTLLELAVGKLIAHVEKLQGKSKFEVKTPTSLTGVRGTVFEVTVKEKGSI